MSSGRLVISLKKSYCPFSSDNISKYEAAEERHRQAQEEQRSTDRLARSRERRATYQSHTNQSKELPPSIDQQHVHLFPEPPQHEQQPSQYPTTTKRARDQNNSNYRKHNHEGYTDGLRRHAPGTFGATTSSSPFYARGSRNSTTTVTNTSIQQQHDSIDPMRYYQDEDVDVQEDSPSSAHATDHKNEDSDSSKSYSDSSSDYHRRRRRRHRKHHRKSHDRRSRRRQHHREEEEEDSEDERRRRKKRRRRRRHHRSPSPTHRREEKVPTSIAVEQKY